MRTLTKILLICLLSIIFVGTIQAQWVQTNGNVCSYGSFAVLDTNLYFLMQSFECPFSVLASSDYGTNWSTLAADLIIVGAYDHITSPGLIANGTNLFLGFYYYFPGYGSQSNLFRSTDGGVTWTQVNNGLLGDVIAITSYETNLLVSTVDTVTWRIYKSSNNGDSWTQIGSQPVSLFVVSGTILISRILDGDAYGEIHGVGVFRSTDNGTTWTSANTGLTDSSVNCFAATTSSIFAGTDHGVFRTTDDGLSWTATGLTNCVNAFAVSETNVFAASDSGVFISTNNGIDWVTVNDGLTVISIHSLAVHGSYLFADAGTGYIWRRPLSEMITDVSPVAKELPRTILMSQNYPNPFNPSTTVSYQLPKQSYVTLRVFDMLGREIATLVNGVEQPGHKSINFDASKLSSGMYFYRLQAGNYIETKKLLLLR